MKSVELISHKFQVETYCMCSLSMYRHQKFLSRLQTSCATLPHLERALRTNPLPIVTFLHNSMCPPRTPPYWVGSWAPAARGFFSDPSGNVP